MGQLGATEIDLVDAIDIGGSQRNFVPYKPLAEEASVLLEHDVAVSPDSQNAVSKEVFRLRQCGRKFSAAVMLSTHP